MRLFIAFDLPGQHAAHVEALVEPWRQRVAAKWTRPEGRHVTLAFLGEQPPSRVPALKQVMDAVAARHRELTLAVKGAGTFGPRSHPRVLWLGLDGALDAARALQADLEQSLGLAPEHGAWSPHLTLARAKSPRGDAALTGVAAALGEAQLPPFAVRELVLFESRGGRYFTVHTATLRARDDAQG